MSKTKTTSKSHTSAKNTERGTKSLKAFKKHPKVFDSVKRRLVPAA